MFLSEGKNQQTPIHSMPGISRFSSDLMLKEVEQCLNFGIKAFAIFPNISDEKKNSMASESWNESGLYPSTIQLIKNNFPQAVLVCDVAMDPYSSDGHDGIVSNGEIINDETLAVLGKMALVQAAAGADVIAPSDMMDGRVIAIRNSLDKNGLEDKLILSYSAKYASSFYSPFRDALNNKNRAISKKTYQMDYRNSLEALKESLADIEEGADILMVKPAGYYLDIIKLVAENSLLPTFAYQVSGEYSMLKLASLSGALDFDQAMLETLYCIKRAGASKIFTYGAFEIAKVL
jgi:porphobilinogen synthase